MASFTREARRGSPTRRPLWPGVTASPPTPLSWSSRSPRCGCDDLLRAPPLRARRSPIPAPAAGSPEDSRFHRRDDPLQGLSALCSTTNDFSSSLPFDLLSIGGLTGRAAQRCTAQVSVTRSMIWPYATRSSGSHGPRCSSSSLQKRPSGPSRLVTMMPAIPDPADPHIGRQHRTLLEGWSGRSRSSRGRQVPLVCDQIHLAIRSTIDSLPF